MARLFLALWPDAALRRAVAAWRDRCRWPAGAAVVATPRLHLTLHFIGEVADERLVEVADGLRVEAPPPFELVLDRAAMWPRGLAVLQSQAEVAPLVELHRRLAQALRALALPVEERRFRAHVTLARRADGAQLATRQRPLRWRVDAYALVRSHQAGPQAGRYEVLRRYR